jgi:hypothetical protein
MLSYAYQVLCSMVHSLMGGLTVMRGQIKIFVL